MFLVGFVCGFVVAMLFSIAVTLYLYRHLPVAGVVK